MAEGQQRGRKPTMVENNRMYYAIICNDITTIEQMILQDGIDVNAVIYGMTFRPRALARLFWDDAPSSHHNVQGHLISRTQQISSIKQHNSSPVVSPPPPEPPT